MVSPDRGAIILLSATLALINVACSSVNSLRGAQEQPKPVAVNPTPNLIQAPPAKIKPAATQINQPTVDAKEIYQQATDVAYSATLLSQSAEISEDWQLVISRWQEAISLLKKVPASSSFYASAKPKISEYQRNLSIAQQQASRPRSRSSSGTVIGIAASSDNNKKVDNSTPTSKESTATEEKEETEPTEVTELDTKTSNVGVFQVPIKRRVRGTPVVEVTFNGVQTFEMIFDTGASGTLITQTMAKSLGIKLEGEVMANTASGKGVKFSTGRVESIAVEGVESKNFPVAIANAGLEIGLLGNDFYGNYDISLKQNVIEFRLR